MKKCKNCGEIEFTKIEANIISFLKKRKSMYAIELADKCNVSITAIYNALPDLINEKIVVITNEKARYGFRKSISLQS